MKKLLIYLSLLFSMFLFLFIPGVKAENVEDDVLIDASKEEFSDFVPFVTDESTTKFRGTITKEQVKAVFDEKRNYVFADRDRIIQVLTNLLENAIKYSDDNGQIEVNTYTKGEKTYISIFNSGDNIPQEDLKNIWDRFYKSDKSRTSKLSTGLGLPIVRLILSQHNEDIWVNNVEGKGVKFTFSLKRSD